MMSRKAIFDALRAIKGPLSPDDVAILDNALDRIGIPGDDEMMHIDQNGLDLIKHFEGLRLQAYKDSVGIPTIGVGHTRGVQMGQVITEAQADAFLRGDVADAEEAVRQYCPVTTQDQFSALVSFTFNLGSGALKGSTLRVKHNAGDYDGAANEFGKWVNAGGVKLAGLVKRRAAEAKLYRGQPWA